MGIVGGIMQLGIEAHGTVCAVWSGIGVVGMARARNTSLADLHTTQPLVSSFVCNAVGIPFWICAHAFLICTPFPSNLPALKRHIYDVEMQEGGARLIWR